MKVARSRRAHGRGGQVAAQGDDALCSSLPIAIEQRGDVVSRGTYAGEVRRSFSAGLLDHCHQRLVGAVLRGTARAVSDGEIVGPRRGKLADDGRQLRHAFRRARREKLEGVTQR